MCRSGPVTRPAPPQEWRCQWVRANSVNCRCHAQGRHQAVDGGHSGGGDLGLRCYGLGACFGVKCARWYDWRSQFCALVPCPCAKSFLRFHSQVRAAWTPCASCLRNHPRSRHHLHGLGSVPAATETYHAILHCPDVAEESCLRCRSATRRLLACSRVALQVAGF